MIDEAKLVGAAVELKKPMPEDREVLARIDTVYQMLLRLIGNEHDLIQLYLATEVFRYYRDGPAYDYVRVDLLRFLRGLHLGDRIKRTLDLDQPGYEKLLRQTFLSAQNKTRLVALKTMQLYIHTHPDRASQFDSCLTQRDKELFKELAL